MKTSLQIFAIWWFLVLALKGDSFYVHVDHSDVSKDLDEEDFFPRVTVRAHFGDENSAVGAKLTKDGRAEIVLPGNDPILGTFWDGPFDSEFVIWPAWYSILNPPPNELPNPFKEYRVRRVVDLQDEVKSSILSAIDRRSFWAANEYLERASHIYENYNKHIRANRSEFNLEHSLHQILIEMVKRAEAERRDSKLEGMPRSELDPLLGSERGWYYWMFDLSKERSDSSALARLAEALSLWCQFSRRTYTEYFWWPERKLGALSFREDSFRQSFSDDLQLAMDVFASEEVRKAVTDALQRSMSNDVREKLSSYEKILEAGSNSEMLMSDLERAVDGFYQLYPPGMKYDWRNSP